MELLPSNVAKLNSLTTGKYQNGYYTTANDNEDDYDYDGNYEDDSESPVELPLYQQRENYYS